MGSSYRPFCNCCSICVYGYWNDTYSKMKNWPSLIATFLLVIFVRIVITKEQTVLMALSSGRYGEAWLGLKALLPSGCPPKKVVRVPANVLKECAKGYVDTPLYHTGGWLMRWLQWGKLRALWRLLEIGKQKWI